MSRGHSPFSNLARRTEAPAISWLMQLALSRPNLISLAAGFTDNKSLPVEDTRALSAELLRSRQRGQSLQYGSTQGDPLLRELTVSHLRELDGSSGQGAYSADRALITHGSQQLLYIVSEVLCDPGDIVLVEDPTYFVYLGILQSHGVVPRVVRMQRDGLDLRHLEEVLEGLKKKGLLRRLKLLYLVSYFQNPTGSTASFGNKSAVLKLLRQYERAAGHSIYLVEDAAYRELRFAGEGVASALAADKSDERVIYAGTYSKPFATGVRVGFGILPEPVFSVAMRIKGNHDFGTSNYLQQLLASALSSGRYQKHLLQVQKRYRRKGQVMMQALREYFPPEVEWFVPSGGLYVWARLPRRIKTGPNSKLFQAALADGVLYVPGQLCYAPDPARTRPNSEMRLSFGSGNEPDIREGIKRLGKAIQTCKAT